jgi:hypothetical protein
MTYRMPSDRDRARSRARSQADTDALNRLRAVRGRNSKRMEALKMVGAVAVLLLIVVGVVFGFRAHNHRVNACKAHGGHVTHHTTYISAHGHTDSDTTYYCATTDRGIIDVW